MLHSVNIRYGESVIGHIGLSEATKLPIIEYQQNWKDNGFPITPSLSFQGANSPASVYNYLDNLLPEGKARELLAQDLGVSERNVFAQILTLGHDVSGAFVFSNEAASAHPIFRVIPQQEMIKRLEQKEDFGLLHWDDKPRLSVAGVQDKLNVYIKPDGQIGFGDGSLSSTHILKFERANLPNLVLNEYICMQLAKLSGLPVAYTEFKRFGPFPALLVTRFDRHYDAQKQRVLRRHVIDGCQALDLPRDYKYERNFGDGRDVKHIRDGASLAKLFNFCQTSVNPAQNTMRLLKWQLFNLMISNYDSHAKNVSFFWGRDRCDFTRSYDLVNVAMFPQFKQVLAMAVGDEFEPRDINAYQLADFAENCGLKRQLVIESLRELSTRVLQVIGTHSFAEELEQKRLISQEEISYVGELIENIKLRTMQLQACADDIADVSL
ncbi:HipA domain-containing protein [Idiomarina sp. HP20-50]|uniref:HipA domain-containing protein n=1 Tax=Idiomarina sp. HP20-50 TaxID=3070813 RepID=UPI00294B858E|nr:HipA domain-containing protein [Idiomarina sp. HP20-50]MDV6316132.1 HipA domain-containing protein [Idiomarina sp. HP20-50]